MGTIGLLLVEVTALIALTFPLWRDAAHAPALLPVRCSRWNR